MLGRGPRGPYWLAHKAHEPYCLRRRPPPVSGVDQGCEWHPARVAGSVRSGCEVREQEAARALFAVVNVLGGRREGRRATKPHASPHPWPLILE
jgi:hypothetical protein